MATCSRGVVVNLNGDTVTINTDASDPNQSVSVDRKDSEEHRTQQDLDDAADAAGHADEGRSPRPVAFVLSGGDKANLMFKP